MIVIVTATYKGEIDARRERRIKAAVERCGELWVRVDWTEHKFGGHITTELTIAICDDHERAIRLASELRACGLMVGVATELEEEEETAA
ncbi:MAG: hypothetical protein WAV38_20165 [Xanthobacteraceae bacterium]